ncbi:two-component system response regulator MnoR [Saccharopolyspora halophila]|uniref:Two-component system response regulator MnoR n=2 Tax=Saccharopolyspora halophila TaxID=405551 RepID=A0ABN3G4T2_9PSEU
MTGIGNEMAAQAGSVPGPREPETGQVRIVLVDDHAIVRHGLRSVLEREDDLQVVGEAATAAETLAVVSGAEPDIVLLDLKLSTGDNTEGMQLCGQLTELHPDLGVLVLTTFLDGGLVVDAIHRGARGYVVKDVDTTELVRSIRAVARRESSFDSRSAAAMVESMNSPSSEPRLTERELNVLRQLAHGLSNRDIGAKLFISETTVKFHVRNIMRKLGATSRAEAVYGASKLRLI